MPVDASASRPSAPKSRVKAVAKITPPVDKEKELQGYGQIAASICVMRGWYADAGAISVHAPPLLHEIAVLADTNESVGKLVDYLCAAGPYTALFAAALPLAMQLAANHGRIDATRTNVAGIVPPDVLDARVRHQIAEAQEMARKEADEARADMERMLAGEKKDTA